MTAIHNRLLRAWKRDPVFFAMILCFLQLFSCKPKAGIKPLFELLNSNATGLHFNNKLTVTPAFNMFKYMYFYNGAGAGAGDFNNDGKTDIFFSSNQGKNSLYLNRGKLSFYDVTGKAGIPQDGGWSTGVSVVDINNDGLLDIYVCKVGQFETLQGKNQLLICKGISKDGVPHYEDMAAAYGLDFSGFSTQAAFLDYDLDGDLDMFLLNHSIHQNGTFAERKNFMGTYHPLTGDRMFRNDGKHFSDVTKESRINSSAIGYGLGIAVSDINLDGYPDLYIGNDFHENDYLYLNQKDGSFREMLNESIMHTSQFSMGVDVADINNDAHPDIISVDMLPADPYILKRSLGEDEYNIFNMKLKYGYNHQYAKNCLQLNRRNGLFSEVAMYAGVHATDWSWAPLWMDFDNDGLKDLFISNGIPKRLNDIDYVNYVSNDDIQRKIKSNTLQENEMAMIDNFPQIKLPNKFYRNTGNVVFQDVHHQIVNDQPGFSNGAVYADFDNDGDLDVLTNNINEEVSLYSNKTNDHGVVPFLEIILKGPAQNTRAVGAKLIVFSGASIRTYEKFPVRGFQSSMEIPLHVGLANTKVDSMFIVWPDNSYKQVTSPAGSSRLLLSYEEQLPLFDYRKLTSFGKMQSRSIHDITDSTALHYKHEENPFVEFDREPLIPFMVSREGPALAQADCNGDGFTDLFIGSSKGGKSNLFMQREDGKFYKTQQPALDHDSTYEDVDACWVDVNNDRFPDLVVASGGNEYYGKDTIMQSRVYINDGKGNLSKLAHAFDGLYFTASCVSPCDFNQDGYADLFLGARAVPWEYGEIPKSYLLQNDGQGRFKDVTGKYSKELHTAGFVKSAYWFDIDNDKDQDLILSLEWDGIVAYINDKGSFAKKVLTDKKGWWNFTLPVDIDGDGDMDFIAGNLGLNNRLKASPQEPASLYYNDFDGNGKKEQVLTYYLAGREIPFANKMDLEKQMPILKKRFLFAGDFAKASLDELFSAKKLGNADLLKADYFANAVLINEGNLNFSTRPLPWEAQLSSYKDAVVVHANNDKLPDIMLLGNFSEFNIQMGRNDADYGTILLNRGNGSFTAVSLPGLQIKGESRRVRKITIMGKEAFVIARNNDSLMVVQFR